MKKDNIKELINYLIVGILTTIVSYGVYYLITISLLDPNNKIELQIANIISWICAVIFAYFTNRKYVFQSKEKNMLKEGSKFCLSRVFTLLLDMLTMFIMVSLLHINDRLSKLVSQVFITIGNYIISKFFVFNENKNNSKNLKVISNTLLIMLGSIIAGTILLVLVYIIPTNHMKENASDVVSVFEREGRYPEIIEGYANTKLDNYTDALIINEAIFDSDDNLIDKAMYVYSKQKKEPLTDVISVIQNEDNEMNNEGYGRYWHGNVIPVKLLLLIFSFSQIRVFNIFIQTILLLGIFYLMIKKNLISNTFSLAISIFLIFPFIIGLSLQYSSIYYIFLISTLIMLKYNNKLKDKYHYFFLIMGIVTNYFDFLTYPIFALGMGLIFKSMLNKKEKLKDSILTIIKYSVFFFLGYFGMWLG
ncbi:MAG: GtrA family protein, partial [Bacilli bacterium]|nr:GtrA family protein [Bacilli bacterium]